MPEGDTSVFADHERQPAPLRLGGILDYAPPLIGGRKYTSESALNGS